MHVCSVAELSSGKYIRSACCHTASPITLSMDLQGSKRACQSLGANMSEICKFVPLGERKSSADQRIN